MMRISNVLRLLTLAIVLGGAAFAVACSSGDDTPQGTPLPRTSVSAADESAIDKTITDVITALGQRQRTALDALANDKLKAKPEQLDPLATCFAAGGALTVRTRTFSPGTSGVVRATINFNVTQDGATTNVRRDWSLERQGDGAFLLSAAPDCPFRRVAPSAATGETAMPSASGIDTPTAAATP